MKRKTLKLISRILASFMIVATVLWLVGPFAGAF